jgi:hypothetical protein
VYKSRQQSMINAIRNAEAQVQKAADGGDVKKAAQLSKTVKELQSAYNDLVKP